MAFPDIDRALFSADLVQIRRRTAPNVFVSAFPAARPIQATVSETGRLMSHPLEDGSVITDHRIIFSYRHHPVYYHRPQTGHVQTAGR